MRRDAMRSTHCAPGRCSAPQLRLLPTPFSHLRSSSPHLSSSLLIAHHHYTHTHTHSCTMCLYIRVAHICEGSARLQSIPASYVLAIENNAMSCSLQYSRYDFHSSSSWKSHSTLLHANRTNERTNEHMARFRLQQMCRPAG